MKHRPIHLAVDHTIRFRAAALEPLQFSDCPYCGSSDLDIHLDVARATWGDIAQCNSCQRVLSRTTGMEEDEE